MQQASPYDSLSIEQLVGTYNNKFQENQLPQQMLADFDNDEDDLRRTLITHLLNDDESEQPYFQNLAEMHPAPPPPRSFV